MGLPLETCPSPATATWPRWRTAITVVERICSRWVSRRGAWLRTLPFYPLRSFRAGARVGGVVHAHELVGAHVGVALRRRQAAVAEELLDHAEIGAGVEQMRRERVAQRVRAHAPADPGRGGARPHDRVQRAHAEPPAARVREQRAPAPAAPLEIGGERAGGPAAVRHDPLLLALAEHADRLLRAVDVIEVEPGELRHPEPGGIEQLEHRGVAG